MDRSSELKSIAQHELKRPNAAVGQSGLMALYEAMFRYLQRTIFTTSLNHSLCRNYGLIVGQVLVTKQDFINDDTRGQLFNTLREMLALNIIPIINTNDAVSPPPDMYEDVDGILGIRDNDSLAARVAVETKADLAILMSDVDGIYDRPPAYENARVMHTFNPKDLSIIE